MSICTQQHLNENNVNHFDAFCRTISFTNLLLNKGRVRLS